MNVTYQRSDFYILYVRYLLLKVEVGVKVQGLGRQIHKFKTPHRVCKSDASPSSARLHTGEPSCCRNIDKTNTSSSTPKAKARETTDEEKLYASILSATLGGREERYPCTHLCVCFDNSGHSPQMSAPRRSREIDQSTQCFHVGCDN